MLSKMKEIKTNNESLAAQVNFSLSANKFETLPSVDSNSKSIHR
jgi:hypothetical protein